MRFSASEPLASWVFGAAVLALLVVLHLGAYRIGENRRKKRAQRGAVGATANRMTGGRERERRFARKSSADDGPIPPPVARDGASSAGHSPS